LLVVVVVTLARVYCRALSSSPFSLPSLLMDQRARRLSCNQENEEGDRDGEKERGGKR